MDDVGRFALLPSERDRREVRAVGLHEEAIERRPRRDLLHRDGILERHDAREGQVEPEIEGADRERAIFAEAVDDPTDVPRSLLFEDVERVAGRRPGVNDDGFAQLARKPDEAREDVALRTARRVVVVVVEANLAHGDDAAVARQSAELIMEGRGPEAGVVRVQPDARGDVIGQAARQVDRDACGRDGLQGVIALSREPHDDEADDTGVERPPHDGVGPFGEMVEIEVTVRVGEREHRGPTGERSLGEGGLLTHVLVAVGDPFSRESAFVVFAQSAGSDIDVDALNAQAARFFSTRIGLAETHTSPPVALVVAPDGEAPGIRRVLARPRDAEDLALAEAADAAMTGLALLARRCSSVWLVERTSEPDGLALRLAVVLASVMLGPVLDARGPELFGVKTGRAKLDAVRRDR